jgi:beta-aspartyl-dipeptidase (metallo-type)
MEELRRVTSDTRVAGLIAGKAGIVEVHMGSEEQGLTLIEKAVEGTEIPLTQLIPTHVNRNRTLFNQTIDFCTRGGVADITTSMNDGAVAPVECFDQILNSKASLSQFTLSTDGNGSMPVFNEAGDMVRMGVGEPNTLLTALRDIIANEKNSINDVLPLVTENAATRLNLGKKGTLKAGNDADILIFSPSNFELQYVVSKGRIMMKEGELVQYGTFETPDSTK